MHNFLRSIGFRDITREQFKKIMEQMKQHPDSQKMSMDAEGNQYVELKKHVARDMGIAMRGTYDEHDHFQMEYYFPYYVGQDVSLVNNIDIVKQSDKDSYQGIVEDMRLGIDLIFFMQDLFKETSPARDQKGRVINGMVKLSALATSGKVLLPRKQTQMDKKYEKLVRERTDLVKAARLGDQNAIEKITLQEMDTYAMISRRLHKEDILSIASTYIMPNGIECDKYTILGDIVGYRNYINRETMEMIHCLAVECNGIKMDVVINERDLLGEPLIGRRFKGDVWMQGKLKGDFQEV